MLGGTDVTSQLAGPRFAGGYFMVNGAAEGFAMDPTTPRPDWYPDPDGSGRQRYWDGRAWAEHWHPPVNAPAGQVSQVGASIAGYPPSGQRTITQRNKRSKVGLAITLACLLVALCIGILITVRNHASAPAWSQVPDSLSCTEEDGYYYSKDIDHSLVAEGTVAPAMVTPVAITMAHSDDRILNFTIRFAAPLPPPPRPIITHVDGQSLPDDVGYNLRFDIENNGIGVASVGGNIDSPPAVRRSIGDLGVLVPKSDNYAERTSANIVHISLDVTQLGIDPSSFNPSLKIEATLSKRVQDTRFDSFLCTADGRTP